MYYKKQGFPEDGELVFCTVTSVQYNSVFVRIEEYKKQGLIHISEISPGRIRNIRDYVKEGKMIVCKVIGLDKSKGNIDVSLRRVTEMQKRQKTDERKQEQKAENIVEGLAKIMNLDPKKVYEEISSALLPKYGLLQNAFIDVVENNESLEKQGVPKKYAGKLEELVKEKIKPKKVEISGTLKLKTYAPNGIENVKKILVDAEKKGNATLRYLGAGSYALRIEAKDYKEAETNLKKALEIVESATAKDKQTEYTFTKKDKKD